MGTKVPGYKRSQEQKFRGTPRTKGPGNESSLKLSFPENEKFLVTKGPGNESSWNFRSWGTKVLHSDLSFLWTKGLGYEKSVIPLYSISIRLQAVVLIAYQWYVVKCNPLTYLTVDSWASKSSRQHSTPLRNTRNTVQLVQCKTVKFISPELQAQKWTQFIKDLGSHR